MPNGARLSLGTVAYVSHETYLNMLFDFLAPGFHMGSRDIVVPVTYRLGGQAGGMKLS